MASRPEIETAQIGTGPKALRIPRVITGLWQAADVTVETERTGRLASLVDAGLNTFDTADIYGSAEEIVGAYRRSGGDCVALTKWCPAATVSGSDACKSAVETAVKRMGSVQLLQYHCWRYDVTSYLDNLTELSQLRDAGHFTHLGVTNFDLAHLRLLHSTGFEIASNQVSASVLDVRAEFGGMSKWCSSNGVAILAYGTLLGGYISSAWVGKSEPTPDTPSRRKWKRVIDAAGGWDVFQIMLVTLGEIAKKHGVDMTAVATRYVLDIPGVAAVIVGSGLDADSERINSTLSVFQLRLDSEDRQRIREAQAHLTPLPGDVGDDNRFPPFLNPSGELNPLAETQSPERKAEIERVVAAGGRVEYMSGSLWEPVVGFCRSVRYGDRVLVSGTTTRVRPSGGAVVGGGSAEDQATFVFDIIRGALAALGASMADVLRTRILYANVERDWEAAGRVQAREFLARHGILPTNTMVGGLTYVVGDGALLEIEAEAQIGAGSGPVLRLDPRER